MSPVDNEDHKRFRDRVGVGVIVGVLCGVASFAATRLPGFNGQDFAVWWLAGKAALAGHNPYTTIVDPLGRPGFFYPFPAAIAAIPLTVLPLAVAGPVFLGLSAAVLAFAITRTAWWPLIMFLSGSMLSSVIAAQAAPLLTAAMLVPPLLWLGALKPNIGLVMLAYRPSWPSAAVMLGIAIACLAIRPTWPSEWLATVGQSPFHFAPWRFPGGILMLLALVRWRRPEARMLAMLCLVPSAPIAYEALPLFLIPKTKREMLALALLSVAMVAVTKDYSEQQETAAYLARARPAIIWLLYIPALVMLLRRPNVGAVPAWIDRASLRLRARGRGLPA